MSTAPPAARDDGGRSAAADPGAPPTSTDVLTEEAALSAQESVVNSARGASAAPDVVMVGGGIMSATLAALLGLVQPDWSVVVLESGPSVGLESSDPWNNAGTGHAALCELNYTPAGPDGRVDPAKAVGINEQFQVSRQLWSSLVRGGLTDDPKSFITSVPHVSFVTGDGGQRYMRARYEALKAQPLFSELEHTADPAELAEWVPLVMAGRDPAQKVAATRSLAGTDVNFGALTSLLLDDAQRRGVHVATGTRVTGLERTPSGRWQVLVQDVATGHRSALVTRFVFVGAGGGALPLLQHSGIKEIRGFGGFPVSGQFLRTRRKDLVSQHHAKVYGQAEVGAPPMSVPHLDLRSVGGEQSLLFGPYAGFSPKFLKAGSLFDLPRSVKANNLSSMLGVARSELALTKYLVQQVLQTRGQRMEALRTFFPEAGDGDWELITAGQRVQVIKKDQRGRGVLQFGTELVTGADGTIAGLLGASPGASTAASAMLTLLERCFPDRMDAWRPLLAGVIPSYGRTLSDDPSLAQEVREETARTLHLTA